MHDCKDKKLGASTRSVKTRSLARRRVQSLSSVPVHDCNAFSKDKKLGASTRSEPVECSSA